MVILREIIEGIFGAALFINALLFVPQSVRIIKEKSAKGVSLTTFLGLLLIQVAIILHAIIVGDNLLFWGYVASILTTGSVVILILIYRKKISPNSDDLNLADVIAQLPGHVYWKDRNLKFIGSNTNNWKDFGLQSLDDYIGKTDRDLFSKEEADQVRKTDENIVRTEQPVIVEEWLTKSDGNQALYLSHKKPLRNKNGEVVGILGTSIDITSSKRKTLDELAILENIIAVMPGNVYWMDRDGVYLGCNDNEAKAVGLKSRRDIVGKRNIDISGFVIPEVLDPINEEVIAKGQTIVAEEPAALIDGTQAVFLSTKTPMYDSQGEVVGLVGISVDITDQKKREQLQFETEMQKELLAVQEQNKKIIDQFVHDVQSPVSGAMMMLAQCNELPEDKRVPLRRAVMRVGEMSRHLLSQYKQPTTDIDIAEEAAEPVLVAVTLMELLAEKKFEYKAQPVDFKKELSNYFAVIQIAPNTFKRALSNLINNAVDAVDQAGSVTVKLTVVDQKVNVTVSDNGKGMPAKLVEKIMNDIEVTEGKADGHGLGLSQVRDMLKRHNGTLKINSTRGKGTEMILSFAQAKAPAWLCGDIMLGTEDIIVVLDDEPAIKTAWQMHFAPTLKAHSNIKIHYFEQGSEALDFVNGLDAQAKARVLLLTDYELLNQDINGIDVIAQCKIDRSVLVTSHYANSEIQAEVMGLNALLLPKFLAEHVPLRVREVQASNQLKQVDFVVVDDDEEFARLMVDSLFRGRKVDLFHSPKLFLEQIDQYPQTTAICLDNRMGRVSGIEVAETLHQKGYQQLYLLSGDSFEPGELPDYITPLCKVDLEQIKQTLGLE